MLHHDQTEAATLDVVMCLNHVGMVEARHDPGLRQETSLHARAGVGEQLDRYGPPQPPVPPLDNHAEAAPTEPLTYLVVGQRGLQQSPLEEHSRYPSIQEITDQEPRGLRADLSAT